MIDLTGQALLHSAFGEGVVASQDGDYLVVNFNEGDPNQAGAQALQKKISTIFSVKNKLIKFKDDAVMKTLEQLYDGALDSVALRKELKKSRDKQAEEERRKTALLKACYQTAGKIVASEILIPGSVLSGRVYGNQPKQSEEGSNAHVPDSIEKSLQYGIMTYLCGIEACKIKFPNSYAQGCASDITSAIRLIEALNAPESKEELFEYLRRYENACDQMLSENRQFLGYIVDFLQDNGRICADIIKEIKSKSVIKPFYLTSLQRGGKKYA